MLYLDYVFMMPNEKLQLQKNQLSRSAARWSKDHIMLGLTPTDAYTKPGSWIKMNFPTVDLTTTHTEDILTGAAAWVSHSSWLAPSWLMDSVRFSVFTKTSNPQLCFSTIWGNPSSCCHFAKCIIKETRGWVYFHTTPAINIDILRWKILF